MHVFTGIVLGGAITSSTVCSGGHLAGGLINASVQHQQSRSKITNKTTTKSQKHHLHIPVKREAEIRCAQHARQARGGAL